jgi:2'-5' RNA ligase
MAFIGISVAHETSRLIQEIDLPGIREDSANLHITLLYLGKDTPIKDIAKAMVAAFAITQNTSPFWVKLGNITCFPLNKDNKCAIIAPAQSKELILLNRNLKKSFNKANVDFDNTYKIYRPHITLSYNNAEIKKTKIEPIEWTASELVLWGGSNGDNKVFVTFPLELKANADVECETIKEGC